MRRITLVRHGETFQNRDLTVQGADPTWGRLTQEGVRQAQLLGKALAGRNFEVAYCSPLERAVMTLSLVLCAREGERTTPLVFHDDLKEINLSNLQGRSRQAWHEAITGDPMRFCPPEGESWLDVQKRVTRYFEETILRGPQQEILIVAHGGVNRGIIASLLGISMAETWAGHGFGAPQDNTCVNILELNGSGEVTGAVINDTSHLAGEFPTASAGQRWLFAERRWELLGISREEVAAWGPPGA